MRILHAIIVVKRMMSMAVHCIFLRFEKTKKKKNVFKVNGLIYLQAFFAPKISRKFETWKQGFILKIELRRNLLWIQIKVSLQCLKYPSFQNITEQPNRPESYGKVLAYSFTFPTLEREGDTACYTILFLRFILNMF